jgi:hypothetical protein
MLRFSFLLTLALASAGAAESVRAQEAPPAGKTDPEKSAQDKLQKQTDAFAKKLLESGSFDDEAKAFVTKVALQKLRQQPEERRLVGGEKFEAALDRIRDALSGGKGADAASGTGSKVREAAATWLVEQARSGQPAMAANATLLLGDLRMGGKPWGEGSRQLAAIAADAGLPLAVRAAAIAGLARHVDELTAAKALPPELVETLAPALLAIVTAPAEGTDPARRWLVSRTLDIVTTVMPAASPDMAKALMSIVSDQMRSTDERVRAAIALGSTTTAESGVDAARAAVAIHQLAADALNDSMATAKQRALLASLSNMPLGSIQQPGLPEAGTATAIYPLGTLEVERDAWRLMKLSEAIARPKLKKSKDGVIEPSWSEPLVGGLARLLEAGVASAAVDSAQQLRTEANELLADPTAVRLAEARETIATWSPPSE